VTLARSTGASTVVPANQQHRENGTVLSNANFAWSPNRGERPGPFLPPTMAGGESVLVAMDYNDANSARWSHPDRSIVDDSRDWRNRIFRGSAYAFNGSAINFAWDPRGSIGSSPVPSASVGIAQFAQRVFSGFGQSFSQEGGALPTPNKGVAFYLDPARLPVMFQGSSLALYVDSQGVLRVQVSNQSPSCRIFLWLDASAPFWNY
jgi:hypothetical protein